MKRFRELVGESSMESDTPSTAARTYKEKPNKEPMAKLKNEENQHKVGDSVNVNSKFFGKQKGTVTKIDKQSVHVKRDGKKFAEKYPHNAVMKEETDTSEKVEMVQSQLHFIKYACEEILEYIDDGGEVEEWYQVKVAKSFSEFESLHAYIEGESRRTGMKESKEPDPHENPEYYRYHKELEKYSWKPQSIKKVKKTPEPDPHENPEYYRYHKEETEQLDEIGNTPAGQKALIDYRDKSAKDIQKINSRFVTGRLKKGETADDVSRKNTNRLKGWFQADKRIKEETELQEGENEQIKGGDPCWKGYEMVGMKKKNGKKVPNCVPEEVEHLDEVMSEPNYSQSIKARQEKANKDKTPFEGSKPKKGTVIDKSGAKHGTMSRVRDLARQALKKQSTKMQPVKESLDESRKAEIVKEIIKKKKNEKTTSDEKFQKEPVLSSEITKT